MISFHKPHCIVNHLPWWKLKLSYFLKWSLSIGRLLSICSEMDTSWFSLEAVTIISAKWHHHDTSVSSGKKEVQGKTGMRINILGSRQVKEHHTEIWWGRSTDSSTFMWEFWRLVSPLPWWRLMEWGKDHFQRTKQFDIMLQVKNSKVWSATIDRLTCKKSWRSSVSSLKTTFSLCNPFYTTSNLVWKVDW